MRPVGELGRGGARQPREPDQLPHGRHHRPASEDGLLRDENRVAELIVEIDPLFSRVSRD